MVMIEKMASETKCRLHWLCVSIYRTRVHLFIFASECFMESVVPRNPFFYETKATCLECQYLHRPNLSEDVYLCLCSLENIQHELDFPVICYDYEDMKASWKPIYISEVGHYT